MAIMSKQLKADMMLLLVVLGWGVSYYMMDGSLEETTPLALNAIRFLGAFLIAFLLGIKRFKKVPRVTLLYSLAIGTCLAVCYACVTYGVGLTTLSNAPFLCALPVIFVPIFQFIFQGKKPEPRLFVAVIMSLVGIMLLTLKEDFSIDRSHLLGDILCTLCAVAYAVDLLITEKAVKNEEVDPYQLGTLNLGVTGVLMLMGTLIFEETSIPSTPVVWGYVIFLTVFCTGLAFVVQPIAQQYTTAAHVGIIFTLEPVFAAIVAYFIAGEVLSPRGYLGAVIMFLALILVEVDPRNLLKKQGQSTR